jgi:hypothetical protein
MKHFHPYFALLLLLGLSLGCRKTDEPEPVVDYRDAFVGEFEFTIRQYGHSGMPSSSYDTTFTYLGRIEKVDTTHITLPVHGAPAYLTTVLLTEVGTLIKPWPNTLETGFEGFFIGHDSLHTKWWYTQGPSYVDANEVGAKRIQ